MGRKILLVIVLLSPLGLYPFLRNSEAQVDIPPEPPPPLTPDQQLVLGCLSIFPGQSFPASIPWEPYRHIGQQESRALEELAKEKPVEFLERCLSRYEKEVQGYRCIFDKHERVDGKMRPKKEQLLVHFREKPFSVHMEWLKGEDKAIRTLYVDGENDNLLMARVFFKFGPIFHKKVDAPDVKTTSRFPITQFGMYIGAKDTLYHMQAAEKAGTLHVRYEGIIPVKELGNRLCYKFVRTPYNPPEGDGVNELTIYIDQVTHMQTGSVLKDSEGKLIAEYFFHDIHLNPTFTEKQFTQKAL
jgi:hypothetical protein